ncbi:hypothetical protein YTPLAS18_39320 [Nitrospira sp.]|nr:hypothetical protein YTPLAS18_39320 [Nitrospira sp.]
MLAFVTCLSSSIVAWGESRAALLDGFMDGVEKSLGEHVAKKNERLTVGNFYTPERPDSHAPIGVMQDHTHNEGEFMMSFRYMHMGMDGNRTGTSQLSNSAVLGQYPVSPTDMTMNMYMFSAMYGFNKTVTLMAMLPYTTNNMHHVTRTGVNFETDSGGFGDLKLATLWRLWAVEAPSIGAHRLHLNLGVGLPTGDIKAAGVTPASGGMDVRLPYPMQLGSGTVDFLPGLTYTGATHNVSWGLQTLGTVRIGTNKEGYSLGDGYNTTTWGAYRWADWVSTSLRFNWNWWGNYSGADPNLNPAMVPTADPTRRGGERLDIMLGANFLFPEWMGVENRLAVEAGTPIYQRLAGPQLETDWIVWAGYQFVR